MGTYRFPETDSESEDSDNFSEHENLPKRDKYPLYMQLPLEMVTWLLCFIMKLFEALIHPFQAGLCCLVCRFWPREEEEFNNEDFDSRDMDTTDSEVDPCYDYDLHGNPWY